MFPCSLRALSRTPSHPLAFPAIYKHFMCNTYIGNKKEREREHGEHGNMTLEHGNDLLSVAGRVCTAKQLEVIRLHETGLGWKRIALILGVSPDTVRSHHRAAVHKIVKEVERVEATRGGSAGET